MRKGDLVKLNSDKCFMIGNGGKRTFPLGTRAEDDSGIVKSMRPITQEEENLWYQSLSTRY